MDVVLAQPRGFCAGVVRAIEIVESALDIYGPPVYVHHEIVHNQRVVEELQSRGAIFTDELEDVPQGAPLCSPTSRKRFEFELLRAPTTMRVSTSSDISLTANCRFWVA